MIDIYDEIGGGFIQMTSSNINSNDGNWHHIIITKKSGTSGNDLNIYHNTVDVSDSPHQVGIFGGIRNLNPSHDAA